MFPQTISGMVSDSAGNPLHFASIFIEGTTTGTTTNESGMYILKCGTGDGILVAKYMGYSPGRFGFEAGKVMTHDFILQEEEIELEEVLITEDGRDPAYYIMQKAIDYKDKNRLPYENYSYLNYSKTVMRTEVKTDSGDTGDSLLMGILGLGAEETKETNQAKDKEQKPGPATKDHRANLQEEADDSTKIYKEGKPEGPEIAYLEENVTEVFIARPDRRKENVISSQVSGGDNSFNILGNLLSRALEFDVYQNLISFGGFTPRGIVSPLSNSAMLFYDFKLLGTVKENGEKSYKIAVIPRRPVDPVFSGIIYIIDSSFAVKSSNLIVAKEAQLQLLDTLGIRQEFIETGEGFLAPAGNLYSGKLDFAIGPWRICVDLISQHVSKEYNFKWEPPRGFFGPEIIEFGDSATGRDSAWWDNARPVPLENDESKDYFEKDSIKRMESSPEWMDSVDRVANEFDFNRLMLGGYTHRNSASGNSWHIDAISSGLGFNPMEGYFGSIGGWESRKITNTLLLTTSGRIRFGFSNRKFSWRMGSDWKIGKFRPLVAGISGGDFVNEFSRIPQIGPGLNSLYCLYAKKNYLALYQRKYGEIFVKKTLFNGFSATTSLRWEDRSFLPVTTQADLIKTNKVYPESKLIGDHQALVFSVSGNVTFRNKYIGLPDGQIDIGSKWPLLRWEFQKGIPGILGSDVSYDIVNAGLTRSHKLGLAGTFSWNGGGGMYLTSWYVSPADEKISKGNQTFFRTNSIQQFHLLDYYARTTSGSWLEGHAEHAFGGFLFNKIPVIRKLQILEYAAVHFLWTEESGQYMEMQIGLEKRIIKRLIPVRLDFHYRLMGSGSRNWGITITSPLESGGSLNIKM